MEEDGPFHVKVTFGVNDVRLLYTALQYYRTQRTEEMKEQLQIDDEHIQRMENTLYAMIMEHNFHNQESHERE